MFVQAVDNRLFKDPIIEGKDFFIRFQEMELPEIIIKYSPTSNLSSSRELAYKRLRELKMAVRIINPEGGEEDDFAFPPTWRGLFPGAKWTFKLMGPIPIPTIFSAVIDYPTFDCRFIAWRLLFSMKDVLAFLDKGEYNSVLISFLAGKRLLPPVDVKLFKKLRKDLEKQMKDVVPGEYITLYRKNGDEQ